MAILVRNLFIFLILLACASMVGVFLTIEKRLPESDYSELLKNLEENSIAAVDFTGNRAAVTLKSGFRYAVYVPDTAILVEEFSRLNARITFHEDYTLYYFQGGLFGLALLLALIVWLSISTQKMTSRRQNLRAINLLPRTATRNG